MAEVRAGMVVELNEQMERMVNKEDGKFMSIMEVTNQLDEREGRRRSRD